jgi:hypothetical protein
MSSTWVQYVSDVSNISDFLALTSEDEWNFFHKINTNNAVAITCAEYAHSSGTVARVFLFSGRRCSAIRSKDRQVARSNMLRRFWEPWMCCGFSAR